MLPVHAAGPSNAVVLFAIAEHNAYDAVFSSVVEAIQGLTQPFLDYVSCVDWVAFHVDQL